MTDKEIKVKEAKKKKDKAIDAKKDTLISEVERIRQLRAKSSKTSMKDSLVLPERPGYKRFFIPEFEGTIEYHLDRGYSFVKEKSQETYQQMKDGHQYGNIIRRQVNWDRDAKYKFAIAMEIPEEIFLEDYKENQKIVDGAEAMMNRTAISQGKADFGEFQKQQTTLIKK